MKEYELTAQEFEALSTDDKITYQRAINYCRCENAAGPGGGWSDGHRILKELGWTEESREEGHRRFVSLVKPAKFTLPVTGNHLSDCSLHNMPAMPAGPCDCGGNAP